MLKEGAFEELWARMNAECGLQNSEFRSETYLNDRGNAEAANTTPLVKHIATLPPRLLRTLLIRGTTLWLLARLMGMAVLTAVSDAASPLLPAWAVVMTATLLLVDLHRRKELQLLHNLGISTSSAVAVATAPAIVLEVVLVMLPR